MQPTRIRSAAMRVLRRGTSRVLPLADLARILADEERITISVDALAASLRGDDALVLLETPHPIEALPLLVHESAPAYHQALSGRAGCHAVVHAEERPFEDAPDAFDAMAAPLLRAWRETAADDPLRTEIATALGGLFALLPAIEDAQAGR